jgi:amylosucrase
MLCGVSSSALPLPVLEAAAQALAGEPEHDRTVVLARLQRHWRDLVTGLCGAYGEQGPALAARVAQIAVAGFVRRPAELRLLDLRRHVEPDWFQSPAHARLRLLRRALRR